MAQEVKYLSYSGLSHLKDVLEGRYEKKGHTHTYAGSDSVGGPANNVKITSGSTDAWRNMLVTTGANDIFSVPNVYANYSRGALKANEVFISGSANNTTGFISSDTTYNLYFAVNGVIPLVIEASSQTNPNIRPSWGSKNAVDLGTSSNGWRNIYGKTLYEDGTSLANKYAAKEHTHTSLNGAGVQSTATTRNLTNFPASKTLFTGYWGTSGSYATGYGTTLDISYSTWYQRLAFNTTGRIEYFRGINTNNSDNTSATLSKVGDLAYLSDIPTIPTALKNPNSLTIQGNGTTLTNGVYDGSAAKTVNITPSNIGAAAASHNHSAANITSGTLSVSRGGTGLSTIPTDHVILGNGTGTPTTAKIAELTDNEIDSIFNQLGVTF